MRDVSIQIVFVFESVIFYVVTNSQFMSEPILALIHIGTQTDRRAYLHTNKKAMDLSHAYRMYLSEEIEMFEALMCVHAQADMSVSSVLEKTFNDYTCRELHVKHGISTDALHIRSASCAKHGDADYQRKRDSLTRYMSKALELVTRIMIAHDMSGEMPRQLKPWDILYDGDGQMVGLLIPMTRVEFEQCAR